MIKPQRLQEEDQITVLAPSCGSANLFPSVLDLGIRNLREYFGLRIKEGVTTRMPSNWLEKHPRERAEDINLAFQDRETKAIVATIGGDDSVRILPYLDRDAILSNPKIIMGYSDTNTILAHLCQEGMITFYGPTIMAGISQMQSLDPAFREHLHSFFFSDWQTFDYSPYKQYSNGYPEWAVPENLGKIQPPHPNRQKWHIIQPAATTYGRLWGGCTTVLQMMIGSKFWPKPDFWPDKILFFETSEEKPMPKDVKYFLRNLGMQGILQQVKGLLFGRARDYTPREKKELDQSILKVVRDEFKRPDMPVWTNLDFGHTDPQIVLPLGCEAMLDSEKRKFQLTESPFAQ